MLTAARTRMRALVNENGSRIQEMLRRLLVEAGWTEDEFLQALVRDVAAHGRDRWMVPSTHLPQAPPRAPEGPRTRSGFITRVTVEPVASRRAG